MTEAVAMQGSLKNVGGKAGTMGKRRQNVSREKGTTL